VAAALRAELAGFRRDLLTNIQALEKGGPTPGARAVMSDLAHAVRIGPHMIPKLGLLDEETIDKVVNAYLAIDQHGDMMLLFGGRLFDPLAAGEAQPAIRATGSRRLVAVSADYVPQAIAINKRVAEPIQEAIDRLDMVASRRGAGRGRAEALLRRAWQAWKRGARVARKKKRG
jgi:hypothetical protein